MKWNRIEIKGVALTILILFPIISVLFVYFGLRFRQAVRGHLQPKGPVAQFYPEQAKQLQNASLSTHGQYNIWAFQSTPQDTLLISTVRQVVSAFQNHPHVQIIHWIQHSNQCVDLPPPYRCLITAQNSAQEHPTLVLVDTSAQLVSTYRLIDSAAMLQALRDLAVLIPPEK